MENKIIYLDNSATTALSNGVKNAMTDAMESYGNPSSLHKQGRESALLLSESRNSVANALNLRASDGYHIFFTASGSEANNLALRGSALAKKHMISRRIITTDSEHPSVLSTLTSLEAFGFEIITVPTAGGKIDIEKYEKELSLGAFAVSMMLVNNETGALYDIPEIFKMAKAKNSDIITHCDAVQGFGRISFSPISLGADMVTVSAHKIHGPKGVGALAVSPALLRSKRLSPIIFGGGQEEGLRSGTENLIGIAGFAQACREAVINSAENSEKTDKLYSHALDVLPKTGARVNIPSTAAKHIISLTLPGIRSETMLNLLSSYGICVSAGSACSSHSHGPSSTLLSFGLSKNEADCTIRISICAENTAAELDVLASVLSDGISRLVKVKR